MKGVIVFLILLVVNTISAQESPKEYDHDTTYFMAYPKELNLRTYYSNKYTGFRLKSDMSSRTLKYKPNTSNNLGVGFTYKWATLNLAYGFGFVNQTEERGKTRYLDLQSHMYFGKWNADIFGQLYQGYYLGNNPNRSEGEYVRPDIKVRAFGGVFQHVFNHEKFSFKAAFLNTEYQKKSAGTALLGASAFYGTITADSTFIPYFTQVGSDPEVDELSFVKLGPSGGYAYTLVLHKHVFVSAALTANVSVGSFSEFGGENQFYYSLDWGVRASAGYNSHHFGIGMILIQQAVQKTDDPNDRLLTGNLRAILTIRFDPKKE